MPDDNKTILALPRLSLPIANVFLIFASLTRGGRCPWPHAAIGGLPRTSLVERAAAQYLRITPTTTPCTVRSFASTKRGSMVALAGWSRTRLSRSL